jgi:FkbM family methyltransferase
MNPQPEQTFEVAIGGSGKRLRARRHSLTLPGGRRVDICVAVDDNDEVSLSIAGGGYVIPAHYRLVEALTRGAGPVADLGAHIGTFSLYAASLGHAVVAVEASERNVALLRESARANGFDQIAVVQAAVSDVSGYLEFTEMGPYGLVKPPLLDWPTVRVPALTLDGLLSDRGWSDVGFVKMDVEGSEVAALRGMRRLIAEEADIPFVFESNGHTLHLFGESPGRLLAAMHLAGYRTWEIGDRHLIPVASQDLQYQCVVDYLALKRQPARIDGWTFDAPRSTNAKFEIAIAGLRDTNPNIRAYTARTLRQADSQVLADARIRASLRALSGDAETFVRESVGWFLE